MCTVSFIARKRGYLLGMNRDEQLTRAKGLPPKLRSANNVKVVSPSEPSGGTWIALNETGVTLALINWYSIAARVPRQAVSRGEVVNACQHATTIAEAVVALNQLPLNRINPFRLIGIFPDTRQAIEWRWDLKRLVQTKHPWKAQQWISSGYNESSAQRIRNCAFRAALKRKTVGTLAWLRYRHRSHSPAYGPFSTCMHRTDAATVSYTEIAVSGHSVVMRYQTGAPCQQARQSWHSLREES